MTEQIEYLGYDIKEVSRRYHIYSQITGKDCGNAPTFATAKKLIDGEAPNRVPSDWQSGGVSAGWEVDLRTGKPVGR